MKRSILRSLVAGATLLAGTQAFAYDWSAAEADLADEIANGNWGVSGGFLIDSAPVLSGNSGEYSNGLGEVCIDYYVTLVKSKVNKGGKTVTVTEETFTYCQPEEVAPE